MQRPCDWKERGMFGEFERRLMWVGRERRGMEEAWFLKTKIFNFLSILSFVLT